MKHIILSIFLFGVYSGVAQVSLDDYKYIIVPKKFDGFKKENHHGTSTLVKHLFTEKGFHVVYEDALPEELNNNRCLGLRVGINEQSSLFSTKIVLVLKDCNSVEIMTSVEGKSKEKDYKLAYQEAIRRAFKSFETINYSYQPKESKEEPVTISFKNDIKKLDEPKGAAPKKKQKVPMVEQEATVERQSFKSKKPLESDYKKAENNDDKDVVIVQVATEEEQSYKNLEPKPSNITKATNPSTTSVLYAQELANGFQLVDSTPKIQLRIFRTTMPDFFLAEGENKNGVLFQKNGSWFFEYYSGEELVVEELDLKF